MFASEFAGIYSKNWKGWALKIAGANAPTSVVTKRHKRSICRVCAAWIWAIGLIQGRAASLV